MFGQAINLLLRAASAAYGWFEDIFQAVGSDAWAFVYAVIVVMLVSRFIIYPFLKGRSISGSSDSVRRELNRTYNNVK